MHKIFCLITTPKMKELAKQLNVSEGFINSLVSTWQTVNGKPNVDPTLEEIKAFQEQNKDSLRAIQVAIPVYSLEQAQSTIVGARAYVNYETKEVQLHLYPLGGDITQEQFITFVEQNVPERHKDLITTHLEYYYYELYTEKAAANRGEIIEFEEVLRRDSDYDEAAKLLKLAKQLYPDNFKKPETPKQTTQVSNTAQYTTPITEFINHSGGAEGADSYWGDSGARFGIKKSEHYHAAEGKKPPTGNHPLSKDELLEADPHLKEANKTLKRKFPTDSAYKDNLLRRNWFQVKNSDAVFAISTIKDGKVEGGTAWAVQMAIDNNKPVHIFDQNAKKWYTYSNDEWIEESTPVLTKNFAGIGTRELNDAGKKAIDNVYRNTINKLSSSTQNTQNNQQMKQEDSSPQVVRTFGEDLLKDNKQEISSEPTQTNTPEAQDIVVSDDSIEGRLNYFKDQLLKVGDPKNPSDLEGLIGPSLLQKVADHIKNDTELSEEDAKSFLRVAEKIFRDIEPEPLYKPDPNDVPKIGVDEAFDVKNDDARAKLFQDFTPAELENRVEDIARKFSTKVSGMVEELIENKTKELNEATSPEERANIEEQLELIKDPVAGRRMAIEALTFKGIVDSMKADYSAILEKTTEELEKRYGEENVPIIRDKYQKIIDNFDALFEDAALLIESAENVRIMMIPNEQGTKDMVSGKSIADQEKEESEFSDDEERNRATGNDGWSFKVRFVDPYSSLSADVKRALCDIKKVNLKGKSYVPVKDDLGNIKYYNSQYIHAALIDKLSRMIDSDDFSTFDKDGKLQFPALEALVKELPWVRQIINKLKADPKLASLFFADFRKDFIPYYKHKLGKDGIYKIFQLNKPSAVDSTLTNTIANYEQGYTLSDDSIYSSTRVISQENADKGTELMKETSSLLQEADEEEDYKEVIDNINKALRMIGVNSSPTIVSSLTSTEEGITSFYNLVDLLRGVFEGAKQLDDNAHLVSNLKSKYLDIAQIVGEVSEANNVSSFREGGNNYPSYSAPNYIETMYKILKNPKRRQSYIESQFKSYEWFYNRTTGKWRNKWMELLETDEDVQDMFEFMDLNFVQRGDVNHTYEEWTPSDIKMAFVQQYFAIPESEGSTKQFAWYNFPIFSDSPVCKFVKMIRYTGDEMKSTLKRLLAEVVKQELYRIKLIEDRKAAEVPAIQNFDKNGNKFHFFPELNDILGEGEFLKQYRELEEPQEQQDFIESAIEHIMNINFASFLESNGGIENITNNLLSEGTISSSDEVIPKLEEYFWNQCFATSQIIQMATTDLAFYKNGTDFQKRFKEVYAAGTKLNTNSKYGRRIERTMYLADQIITSADFIGIKKNILKAIKEGRLSKIEADSILYKFKDINVADAQAFRSISSFRAVLDMMGLWTDQMAATVERFERGEWDIKDFNTVWQTIKPFVFTQIDKPDGRDGRIKVPHQNKNSEFLLLSMYALVSNSMVGKQSPRMAALNRFMEDNNIDVIQFESAVKAGGQGIVDINISPSKLADAITNKSITVSGKTYKLNIEGNKFKDVKSHFDKALDNGSITQGEYNFIMNWFEPSEDEVYQILTNAAKDNFSFDKKVNRAIKDNFVIVGGVKYNTAGKDYDSIMKDLKGRVDSKAKNGIKQWEYDEIEKYFTNGFREEVVHEIPYKDYVVQQPTPEHLFDVEAVFGSQFRNLIISDLPEDISVTVNGVEIKGRDNVINLYQSLIVENLLEDYKKLSGKFVTIETLQKAMLEIIRGNPKYGRDMLDALRIVEHTVNGQKVKTFNIPLHNPSTTLKVQELINSMFKNAITKQTINGGNCILVSNFGFTRHLRVLRNEDGSIKGAECYLPFYTKKYFEPFMVDIKDKDGKVIGQEVDIEAIKKQDPELLKIIGYRIPTEDKYSMIPLIIKGFLPHNNGSCIMLPADITQIAGSDFDVDKLFLMIPEWETGYKVKRDKVGDAWKAFYEDPSNKDVLDEINKNVDIAYEDYVKKHPDDDITRDEYLGSLLREGAVKLKDFSERTIPQFYKWLRGNSIEYAELYIRKKQYDVSKGVTGNNRSRRNNAIIDIAYGILTHLSTAEKINNPGNFDAPKLAARIANISKDSRLLEEYRTVNNLTSLEAAAEHLLNAKLDDLDDFLKAHQKERNPLSPGTFAYYHQQNMTGSALIGMYANNTTMQAKFQRTSLALKKKYTFKINSRVIQSLHDDYTTINDVKERISRNCATFSAASVDNVKDPVLADLLQNKNTANIAGFMLRAGMSVQEVGLMFTQPLVREWIEETGGRVNEGNLKTLHAKVVEICDKRGFKLKRKRSANLNPSSKDLLLNILRYNALKASKQAGIDEVDGISGSEIEKKVAEATYLFSLIAEASTTMGELTRICRGDSPTGAAGTSIAKVKAQTYRVKRFMINSLKEDFPFSGVEDIMKNHYVTPDMSIDEMREKFNNSTMPMLQAFYSLGIDFARKLDKNYFPQLSSKMDAVLDNLYRNSPNNNLSDNIIEMFYSDFTTYALSKTKLFGDTDTDSFNKKRNYYLYDFPHKFMTIISDPNNKDIQNLGIIRKMRVLNGEIVLDRSGRLTTTERELLMRDFTQMLYMGEEARKLALDLFMYAYYNDGFNFGPNSFGNFFSTRFINSIPEVTNALRDMIFNEGNDTFYSEFLEQFYLNHYDEYTLVPYLEITKDAPLKLVDENTLIVDADSAINNNYPGRKVYKYFMLYSSSKEEAKSNDDPNYILYEVDPDSITSTNVTYRRKFYYKDPIDKLYYNANSTAKEIESLKVDPKRLEALRALGTPSNDYEISSSDSPFNEDANPESIDDIFGDQFDVDDDIYSFIDGLDSLDEDPCNLDIQKES